MRALWAATGAVAAAGVAFGGLGLAIARRLTEHSERRYDLTIRGVETSGDRLAVILDRTPRTTLPGFYSLFVQNGGRVRLSPDVEDRGPGLVARHVLGESREGLSVGARASWSGILFSTPEEADLEAAEVEVATDAGPAPAWLIAARGGSSTTWAIHIHGLGGTRAGVLRGVPVASEAGLTSLVVTFRNDGEGPVVGAGRSGLGAAELHDVREAVRFARENGAGSIVLFGWSMGAAIALQLTDDPEFRGLITGLVLESPVLDWVSTIRTNCARAGLPAWTGSLAVPWLDLRILAPVTGLASPVAVRRFNWIARADHLAVPILIVHGTRDTSSPSELSTRLRELRPDIVDVEEFDADHTMCWNSDPERWEGVVSGWLAARPLHCAQIDLNADR